MILRWELIPGLIPVLLTIAAACSGQVATEPARSCYDVTYYDLALKVLPADKTIEGSNTLTFRAVRQFSRMQVDLAAGLTVTRVTHSGRPVPFTREGDALLISLSRAEGEVASLRIDYHGTPKEVTDADGGADWRENLVGKPWITFQSGDTGASRWWPCKDDFSDKADSMRIRVTVPAELTAVTAGTLRRVSAKRPDGFREFDRLVSHPVAPGRISLSISDYALVQDTYTQDDGRKLPLHYYVLPYQADKAKIHFQQLKEILACCERYLGRLPFAGTAFAVVETPYLGRSYPGGMAYGNFYRNVPLYGFDQVLIHETARSYFGNSVSWADPADRWIEESFATYLESLYLECRYGEAVAGQYLREQQRKITNDFPVIGTSDSKPKDADISYKGAWMLHTLRHVVEDDGRWFGALKGLTTAFRYRSVTTEDVVRYLNQHLGIDCTPFFNQYLFRAAPPIFEFKAIENPHRYKLSFRWAVAAQGFAMPVEVTFDDGRTFHRLEPSKEWQTVTLRKPDGGRFRVATEKFYVVTRQQSFKN